MASLRRMCRRVDLHLKRKEAVSPLGINGLFMSHCKHQRREDRPIMCVSCRTASPRLRIDLAPLLQVGMPTRNNRETVDGCEGEATQFFTSTPCVCQILIKKKLLTELDYSYLFTSINRKHFLNQSFLLKNTSSRLLRL